jgi:hypothetical protein
MDSDVILMQWRSVQRTISAVPTRELGHLSTGFARSDPRNGWDRKEEVLGGIAQMPGSSPSCASDDLVAAIQYDGDEVRLRRWNKTGEPLPDVRLFDGGLTFRIFPAIADIFW